MSLECSILRIFTAYITLCALPSKPVNIVFYCFRRALKCVNRNLIIEMLSQYYNPLCILLHC